MISKRIKSKFPMRFRTLVRYQLERAKLLGHIMGLSNWRLEYLSKRSYSADGFITIHDTPFLRNQKLINAYEKALEGLEDFYVKPNSRYRQDHWESSKEILWRAHIVTWAAKTLGNVPGDFVECGVGNGLLSKTICEYMDFETQNRRFYLLDCWELFREVEWNKLYPVSQSPSWFDFAASRFSTYPNVKLIKGMIPESLEMVKKIDKVAYLSIDMNDGEPEIAALKFFWDKLSPGAIVYFDDYLWGYEKLQKYVDEFLADKNVELLHIPTGNSILIKN